MNKLYKTNELYFALILIGLYCMILTPIRGHFGDESPWMLCALLLIAISITAFVKANHLKEKYGLTTYPKHQKRYLYFIPMWILVTGNLWGGIRPAYQGVYLLTAVLSMLLIGYIEELIFRGFLFKALISKIGTSKAIIISSVTFGIGHIVNLFIGQLTLETVIQVFFAISWGFILTMVFYKSGSLLPGIIAHGLIDVFAVFSLNQIRPISLSSLVYPLVTIGVAAIYCAFLARLKNPTISG